MKKPLKKKRTVGLPGLKHKAWGAFSRYIRQKYADKDGMVHCVTCGDKKHWKELDAGHFRHAGKANHVSYDERNIHPQCTACNRYNHGNLIAYTMHVIQQYGKHVVDELRQIQSKSTDSSGMKRYELEEIIEKYSRPDEN